MRNSMTVGLLALSLALALPAARAGDEHFAIHRFDVEGNTLLPQEAIAEGTRSFTGGERNYADVERAREALERLYRQAGFSAVLVHVPEQELTHGVVRLQVIESRIGQIGVRFEPPEGEEYFSAGNIRSALPALQEGAPPNTARIADNVQLANENPAKQVELLLKAANRIGEVNAELTVRAGDPKKMFVTLDNTGNASTGEHRIGFGFQHANLFDRDHVGTFNFTTSPQKPDRVASYSVSYRVPLYPLGDSVDLIAGKSDVDAGTSHTVAGPLSFTGKGDIYGVRYNLLLRRRGEYAHRVIAGLDYRAFDNTCSLAGFGPAGCGPSAVDVTVRPVSISYAGQWQALKHAADVSVTYARNWAGAQHGDDADFVQARPATSGAGGASAGYRVLRANGSFIASLDRNWQVRMAGSLQVAFDALISAEQFGLAGSGSVRGFGEREASRDSGHVVNIEVYSPPLSASLVSNASVRALAFYDYSGGRNRMLDGDAPQKITLSSAGLGLRLAFDKNLQARVDVAAVVDGDQLRSRGHVHGHISINYAY